MFVGKGGGGTHCIERHAGRHLRYGIGVSITKLRSSDRKGFGLCRAIEADAYFL